MPITRLKDWLTRAGSDRGSRRASGAPEAAKDALGAFWLEANVYRLGQYTPVSLRDQVVRANYLIDLLFDEGEIGSDRRLVVLGAGLAGVAAALAAVRRGVQDVVLIEKADVPLSLQARCGSRWVDPTQYDWPAAHWREASWPVSEGGHRAFTGISSPFDPMIAALAVDWSTDFVTRIQAANDRVTFRTGTTSRPWSRTPGGRIHVPTHDESGNSLPSEEADLLIVALGFGSERSDVADGAHSKSRFSSLDFWSNDLFEESDSGVPELQPKHYLIVSGAGDGALQDFVRLATGVRSAAEILDAAWKTTDDLTEWKTRLSNAWHWEEQAIRALEFAPSPITRCEILNRLHGRYMEAVRLFAGSPEWSRFKQWLDTRTRPRHRKALKLLVKCTHFGPCYGLNHIAALLVLKYLDNAGSPALEDQTAMISTMGRHADSCRQGCWGRSHDVVLARGTSCETDEDDLKGWPHRDRESVKSQGIVIRHGIAPLEIAGFPRQYLTQQPVPSHLP